MKRGCQVCNKLHVDLQKHFITTCMLWFWVKPFGATFIKNKFRNLNNVTVVVCFHQCLKTENTKIKKNCHTCQDYWKQNCNYLMNLNISFKTSFIYQHTFWKVLLTIGPFRQNIHAAWRIVKEVRCSTRRDTPKIDLIPWRLKTIYNYIISSVMHAFWLVLTYDLLEDRRLDDVIIKTF